jgi:toxin YhaV
MSPSREPDELPFDSHDSHGWQLYAWGAFATQLADLVAEVRELRRADPNGYRNHPVVKLLLAVIRLVMDVIPVNPASGSFLQGNKLGPTHRHWMRAKFYRRFRLFFRFHSSRRIIIYTWMNDESSLRNEGGRKDPYHLFRRMLERGAPPSDFDALLRESRTLKLPPDMNDAQAER